MPEQLDERLALLEAEIELLKCKIARDPNNLIAKSDLSSCIETDYLLKSPGNVRHLMDSFEEYRSESLYHKALKNYGKN